MKNNIQKWPNQYALYFVKALRENGKSLQIVIGLFLAGVICGGIKNQSLLSFVNTLIAGLLERFQDFHDVALFLRIFINNFLAAMVAAVLGFVFGIFPLISAFLNGLLLGAVLFNMGEFTYWNFLQRALCIVPHGIFELPAFFLSLSLGVRLGTWPLKKEKRLFLKSLFNEGSRIFFKIIIPFLLIAAAIETMGIELLR